MKVLSVIAAMFAALVVALSAQAAPPQSSISLDQADPHWGDVVSFTYSASDKVRVPAVYVRCYQGDELVYATGGTPIFESFPLSSPSWQGGAAHCVATLEDESKKSGTGQRVAAEDEFEVSA